MLSILLENKVDFLLVGAYAMAVNGFPRATADLVIFMRPSEENAKRVYQSLANFGASMEEIETENLAKRGTIFQIGDSSSN